MKYILNYNEFLCEAHHMLSGDNSLSDLARDLSEFVRWQMSHSIKKKKEYDPKKYIYYYLWEYEEIVEWFNNNNKKFHYPVFLIENRATIRLKISLARMVKGRRKEHDTNTLIKVKGNERASHSTKTIETDDNHVSKRHTIYLNTYYLAKERNTEVRDFIMSDQFEKELAGTVRHEFMHAFDSYKITGGKRTQIDVMKDVYKKYKNKNKIGKEWTVLKITGTWSGKNFTPNVEMLSEGNNLKTFLYMLLYYMTDTEMNAYIQTFYNQILNSDNHDLYDSDIYKRYKTIETVLKTDFNEETIKRNLDKKFLNDFSRILKTHTDNPIDFYNKFKKAVLKKIEKYFKKLHTVYFDLKSALKNNQ